MKVKWKAKLEEMLDGVFEPGPIGRTQRRNVETVVSIMVSLFNLDVALTSLNVRVENLTKRLDRLEKIIGVYEERRRLHEEVAD